MRSMDIEEFETDFEQSLERMLSGTVSLKQLLAYFKAASSTRLARPIVDELSLSFQWVVSTDKGLDKASPRRVKNTLEVSYDRCVGNLNRTEWTTAEIGCLIVYEAEESMQALLQQVGLEENRVVLEGFTVMGSDDEAGVHSRVEDMFGAFDRYAHVVDALDEMVPVRTHSSFGIH